MIGEGGQGLGEERGASGDNIGHSPISRVAVSAILADVFLVSDDQVGHSGGLFRAGRGNNLNKQESEATHKLDTQRTSRAELPDGQRESW